MIRQAIRFAWCVLIITCFYAGGERALKAQQGNQAPLTPSTSVTGAKSSAQNPAPAPAPLPPGISGSENVVDGSIPDDPELKNIVAPYRGKVLELSKPIGRLERDMKKEDMGGGAVGNFVADALRSVAEKKLGRPVVLSVINTSGIRKNWISAGEIRSSDIYEMLPFENALVALDLTGEQLLRFMEINVRKGNSESGARIVYRNNTEKKQNELVSIKLVEGGREKSIDPKATYTIVSIDYLVKRGGDYKVLQEATNMRPLGITMRDAMLEYVKAETAAGRAIKGDLDGRFKKEGDGGDAEVDGQ
jgi:2',3'-cyclic-nucleotide 2'-phosphodiesterase (5'-nucleotidase family)